MSRFRVRVGRRVEYFPTSTEVTTFGAGPYGAVITAVNADGTVNLAVDVPSAVVEAGTVDGTWGASPEGDLLDELRTREQLRFKASVAQGTTAGTFSLLAGASAV